MMQKIVLGILIVVLFPFYSMLFISIHELGHVAVMRLLGDEDAWFYLVKVDQDGRCLGCTTSGPGEVSWAGDVAIRLGGLLATQTVALTALLLLSLRPRRKWIVTTSLAVNGPPSARSQSRQPIRPLSSSMSNGQRILIPLPLAAGADICPLLLICRDRSKRLSAWTGVTSERLRGLFERYGTRAEAIATFINGGNDRPLTTLPDYSLREVHFIVAHEKVFRLDDFLLRRSMLAMLGQVTREMLDELAEVLAIALGWTKAQRAAEVARTLSMLANRHGLVVSGAEGVQSTAG